mmetsp:Transcript_5840/g.9981  ORF Transcript_5840/g.9981 Transcript_5840/m.9981 type:complete len:87 (+) Transcript_5840:1036-1296(+)
MLESLLTQAGGEKAQLLSLLKEDGLEGERQHDFKIQSQIGLSLKLIAQSLNLTIAHPDARQSACEAISDALLLLGRISLLNRQSCE